MAGIWQALTEGDVGEVERLVGQDPGLLEARSEYDGTPLMKASARGHVGVVRCLLDKGAAINASDDSHTALWCACCEGHTPVVQLLLERGADATIGQGELPTPLMIAVYYGYPEAVRLLLGHPSGKSSINHVGGRYGETALWRACHKGRSEIARALLEAGADHTIADNEGITPMEIAKEDDGDEGDSDDDDDIGRVSAKGRRECVAALEVRLLSFSPPPLAYAL
jgi:uncharacterized protein